MQAARIHEAHATSRAAMAFFNPTPSTEADDEPAATAARIRQISRDPEILMAAVVDADNRTLSVHPDLPAWLQLALHQVPSPDLTVPIAWPPVASGAEPQDAAYVTRLALPSAYGTSHTPYDLIVIRRASTTWGAVPSSRWWVFDGLFLMAALIGCGLAWRRVRRVVLQPIHRIARVAEHLRADGHDVEWPDGPERTDEIGRIEAALRDLWSDQLRFKQRAVCLERDLEHHIHAKTREISAALNRATQAADRDELTGLLNRRALSEKLPVLFDIHRRAGEDLSVILFDLDNFKVLNDTLGHTAGDELLTFVGELLRGGMRDDDLAFRYGGDEFVVICPRTTRDVAAAVAARLLPLFLQRARLFGVKPTPSLSVGVAALHNNQPATSQELVQMADAALYAAKRGGKGTVVVFDGSPTVLATT